MTGMLPLLLAAGGLMTPVDTLVEVHEGDRLVLSGFEGEVVVESWDRSMMRLEVEAEDAVRFRIRRSGSTLELRLEDRRSRNRAEELRIILPPWMDLELSGRELDARIQDLDGEVSVRNLEGDLILWNLTGPVDASTAEGSVDAIGLSGTARLRTGDDDLTVVGSSAALELETVDGEVHLKDVESRRILVQSTDGDIDFSGRALEGGEYRFSSHGGDIRIGLLPPVNVDATVLAYGGDFQSDFPVRARGFRSGEGLEFTLGSGGARLILEAFKGEISLVRGPLGPVP